MRWRTYEWFVEQFEEAEAVRDFEFLSRVRDFIRRFHD
jgi:hypothetical protein